MYISLLHPDASWHPKEFWLTQTEVSGLQPSSDIPSTILRLLLGPEGHWMTSVRSETCKQDPVSNYIILLKPKVSLMTSGNSGTHELWSFSSHMSIHLLDSEGLWSTVCEIQWGQWLTPLSPLPAPASCQDIQVLCIVVCEVTYT